MIVPLEDDFVDFRGELPISPFPCLISSASHRVLNIAKANAIHAIMQSLTLDLIFLLLKDF